MKLKRMVSAIAALAVSVTTFAGMAVTANASSWSNPYSITTTETIGTVYLGTNNNDGTVTPEEFENYVDASAFDKVIPTRDSGVSVNEAVCQYGSGNGIAIDTGVNSRTEYLFKSPVTEGKLVFRGDFASVQRKEFVEIIGEDIKGESVSLFKIVGPDANYGAIDVFNNNIKISQNRNSVFWRGYGLTVSSVVIDLDEQKVSFSYDGIKASENNDNNHSGTFDIKDIVKITGIAVGNMSGLRVGTKPILDNVALYNVIEKSNSVEYTVNAVAGGDQLSEIYSGQVLAETDCTVNGIPEVIEKDGVYYQLDDSNVNNHTYTFKAEDSNFTKEINYTANPSIVAFFEVESMGNTIGATSKNECSNSRYSAVSGGKTADLGTFDPGIYKITINFIERGDRGIYIRDLSKTIDSNEIDNFGTDKNTGSGVLTLDNITLQSQTHLGMSGYVNSKSQYNQSSGIDYVIIEKTGDIVTPIPGAVEAEWQSDYNDEAATDAATGASLWNAIITGNGTGFNKIRVDGVIKSGEDTVKTASPVTEDLGTTITTGSAYIYIAVNQAVSKLEGGQTMEVTVTPVSE